MILSPKCVICLHHAPKLPRCDKNVFLFYKKESNLRHFVIKIVRKYGRWIRSEVNHFKKLRNHYNNIPVFLYLHLYGQWPYKWSIWTIYSSIRSWSFCCLLWRIWFPFLTEIFSKGFLFLLCLKNHKILFVKIHCFWGRHYTSAPWISPSWWNFLTGAGTWSLMSLFRNSYHQHIVTEPGVKTTSSSILSFA